MSRSRGVTAFTTRSPIEIEPSLGFSKPATSRSAVVLPQPDGPTRIRNSPSAISSDRSSSATTSSEKRFVTWSSLTSAIAYPLSPVVAIPRTKYRCATKKSTRTGIMLITFAAMSRFVLVWCAPWNVASPSWSVMFCGL